MGASTSTRELEGRSVAIQVDGTVRNHTANDFDAGLVTSRSPAGMDAFLSKMLEEIREGVHATQHA